jgi:uncharacterized protein YlzI (FlbEa/FlbD family)
MLITLTPMAGEPIEVNPTHIVLVEAVGGERPHTKVSLVTREQVQVKESPAEIKALCNPAIVSASLGELQYTPPQQMPGPSEVKSDEPEPEATGGRKRK